MFMTSVRFLSTNKMDVKTSEIIKKLHFNLLTPELFFFNFSTPVYKM